MRSRDAGSWMWAEALELLQNAERLQRQFFRVGALQGAPCWEPPVDVYESESELRLLVALPGVTAQQLEVMFAPGVLVVRGERSLPKNLRRAVIRRLEIPYGRFERHIALPAGAYEPIEQHLEDGCLTLTLRRTL